MPDNPVQKTYSHFYFPFIIHTSHINRHLDTHSNGRVKIKDTQNSTSKEREKQMSYYCHLQNPQKCHGGVGFTLYKWPAIQKLSLYISIHMNVGWRL